MKPEDLGPYINTISGNPFFLGHPDESVIDPAEIAYALSNLCRFTGHVKEFYSVAQHCVLVSRHVPQAGDGHAGYALEGLLHDAAEAYTGDINHPLKVMLGKAFSGIEAAIELAIAVEFNAQWPWPDVVKDADYAAYATEIRDVAPPRVPVMFEGGYPHEKTLKPWIEPIVGWSPEYARKMWIRRFEELT